MIKQEELTINGKNFIKTYSDEGKYIIQNETDERYEEAIDILPLRFTYTETDEPIEILTEEESNE